MILSLKKGDISIHYYTNNDQRFKLTKTTQDILLPSHNHEPTPPPFQSTQFSLI